MKCRGEKPPLHPPPQATWGGMQLQCGWDPTGSLVGGWVGLGGLGGFPGCGVGIGAVAASAVVKPGRAVGEGNGALPPGARGSWRRHSCAGPCPWPLGQRWHSL